MGRATGDSLRQRVECECGEWEFRRADASMGLAACERWCPRCERRMLLVYRGSDLLGVRPLNGSDSGSYGDTLDGVEGLDDLERRRLVKVARERASRFGAPRRGWANG